MEKQTLELTTQLARDHVRARQKFHRVLRDVISEYDAAPLDDDFWSLAQQLADKLAGYKEIYNAVKREIGGVFWQVLHDGEWSMEAWEKCVGFYQAYRNLVSQLYDFCFEFEDIAKCDDSYGDFMDMLPLAGRTVIETLLAGEDIANGKQLFKAIEAAQPKLALAKAIINGENYIAMGMEEKLFDNFPSVVRPGDGWPEEVNDDGLAGQYFELTSKLDGVTAAVDKVVEGIIGDDFISCSYDPEEQVLVVFCCRMPEDADAFELVIEKRTGFEEIKFMVGGR